MPARILRWTVCVVLALGGAACGGGDDGGASDSSSAAAAPTAAATADGAGAASELAGGGGDDGGDSDDSRTYTVKPGDTLSSIAQELGTTVEALVEANDITNPDVIDIGQRLKVPSN